ncbi:LytTR family transcriptional regulator [bacterium BMS3Abin03]|nr:LytTR family transcriptional regulator [bacterium BMS3Abin03]
MGIIIKLVNQYYLLKKHLKTANNINSSIKTSTEQSTIGFAANLLEFEIDRFKKVNIEPENLIYIEAFGNYINVIYADNDIKKITVRETITNIEDKMEGVIIIYRPHRSYLVNLQKVEKITGDSQGLKLHLKSIDKVIPVSRNKIKEFRERITSHN